MKKQPIGVFDSGLGGLTILKALRRTLPHEDLIYFGDTANVPYGSKSKTAVTRFSLAIARFLQEQNAKLIVVACNTASAFALPQLQKQISVPVIGVIEPGAAKAAQSTQNNKVAVLGTQGTIKSKAYEHALAKSSPAIKVTGQACPLFVPLVEENWGKKPAAELIAREYLKGVEKSGADTVILGCTHYPVLKSLIAKILGKKVKLVDSAQTLAQTAQQFLAAHQCAEIKGKGKLTVYASDDPQKFKQQAAILLGEKPSSVRLKKLNV
ncbi:MAG: glutamate racemase [Elusimicrobiaceae bacterium]|uniref:Glutamate racemase n=1 Tax=Candidatus Avelusimicrobium gallicola TaxID=2562704 RepID=A0A928DPC0_9BACT|nr:glutamate racemase [Elusimicrobium sp.]MBQ9971808.1 glutamate racemase [Elusimicrobiaceae bacterium]